MNFLYSIYNELLWRPLLNALVWLYTALPLHDLGLAIIVLTVVVRACITPFLLHSQRAQKKLTGLQTEVKHIQEKLKSDKEAQAKALMELYAREKVNPFSGCLVIIIQLPLLIALFHVFRAVGDPNVLSSLYSFIHLEGSLNPISFGFLDLSKGNIGLGVLAAVTQYFATRLSTPPPLPSTSKEPNFASIMRAQALYLFPILILFWSYSFPSALVLYWTALNLFGIVQEGLLRVWATRYGSGNSEK